MISLDTTKRARAGTKGAAQPRRTTLTALWHQRLISILAVGISDLDDRKLLPARRVQKARQATKAAKALLRLAPMGLKRQARGLSMALGGARRQLGAIRDRDAMADALRAIAERIKLTPQRLNPLIKPLTVKSISPSVAQVDEVAHARETLKRVLVQIRAWKVPRGRDFALLDAIKDDHRRLRRDARPGLARLDVEDLHDLRKRAITHRHHVALLAEFVTSGGKEITKEITKENTKKITRRMERAHRLHEAIGGHRDLHLLAEYLRTLPDPKTYATRKALLDAIEKSMEKRIVQAIRLERQLDRVKPKKVVKAARQRLA